MKTERSYMCYNGLYERGTIIVLIIIVLATVKERGHTINCKFYTLYRNQCSPSKEQDYHFGHIQPVMPSRDRLPK